jgi:glycosyltransferase involved in cell wall biosynthesis|tara:strand:+ start:671 stop:823 length:153 start_codon:yes stop_codon:yes gene_type:complete
LDGFVDAILKLEENKELCESMGINSRKYVESNLTFEIIGERLSKMIETLG